MSNPHRQKLSRMQERAIYEAGMAARQANKPSHDCPHGFSDLQRRSWFLAGWHDADMERRKRNVGPDYR